jgi:hypothetical protein
VKNQYNTENAEYFDMLKNTEDRQRYFKNLAQEDPADNAEVARVKNRINKLI